jgi:hypothetical protein
MEIFPNGFVKLQQYFSNCFMLCFFSKSFLRDLFKTVFLLYQGYGVEHTLKKWSELKYTSHWIVLAMYIVSVVL